MNETGSSVRITLRIPGNWSHPRELVQRMPEGFRLSPEALIMPDGTQIEFSPVPPDDQFAQIFETSCRRPATWEETEIVNSYSVNICLSGPGGSLPAALSMMQAGAAILKAGAGGVFIDNSALAHGASDWIAMTEDGSSDAVSFAFAAIIRGDQQVWTMGMHVMGLPDVVMQRADLDAEGDMIVEMIRYLCRGDKPVGDGHWLADELGPRFSGSGDQERQV